MTRAIELAENGLGKTSPNPMVGCVIVYDNKIIGEGWHEKYGGPHAEVNAINAVKDQSLLEKSTLYVSLEPCAHYGKTPPCVELIIDKNIPKVVVANTDPNPMVAGKGINILREAGIDVITGVLEQDGNELNKRFFTYMQKKRPYIILKWAQTADGFIARENNDSKWISNEQSRKLVHKWRTEEEAILVGTKTALFDNPRLNVRDWEGKDPVRIVIDKDLSIPKNAHLFDQTQVTLCYNNVEERSDEYNEYIQINFSKDIIPQILEDLYVRKIQSVIVEGGTNVLNGFIEPGLWDEARVFTSPQTFGNGVKAPEVLGEEKTSVIINGDVLNVSINTVS